MVKRLQDAVHKPFGSLPIPHIPPNFNPLCVEPGSDDAWSEFASSDSEDEDALAERMRKLRSEIRAACERNDVRLTLSGQVELKALQLESVRASAQAGRDVILQLPTGYGKTLCFEVAALLEWESSGRVTLVVVPTVALIDQHVQRASARGFEVAGLTGPRKNQAAIEALTLPKGDKSCGVVIVYTTPDQLAGFDFPGNTYFDNVRSQLGTLCVSNIARLVIDEAHEVILATYRPVYAIIGQLRRATSLPVTVVTATCTPCVEDQLISRLALRDIAHIVSSPVRPNHYYLVATKVAKKTRSKGEELELDGGAAQIWDYLKAWDLEKKCGIIYCRTKEGAEKLARLLGSWGCKIGWYCSTTSEDGRAKALREWYSGELNVICATEALGLGIDKMDVRFVFHASAPNSLSAYQQQTGRGGRDGQPTLCALFVSGIKDCLVTYSDHPKQKLGQSFEERKLAQEGFQDRLNEQAAVIEYAYNSVRCRHALLLEHQGDPFASQECGDACDNCLLRSSSTSIDVSSHGTDIMTRFSSSPRRERTFTKLRDVKGTLGLTEPQRNAVLLLLFARGYLGRQGRSDERSHVSVPIVLGPNKEEIIDFTLHWRMGETTPKRLKSLDFMPYSMMATHTTDDDSAGDDSDERSDEEMLVATPARRSKIAQQQKVRKSAPARAPSATPPLKQIGDPQREEGDSDRVDEPSSEESSSQAHSREEDDAVTQADSEPDDNCGSDNLCDDCSSESEEEPTNTLEAIMADLLKLKARLARS